MDIVRNWFRRNFSDPQAVVLTLLLVGGLAVVLLLGGILGPLLAAVVIAYLLNSPTELLHGRGVPHIAAVLMVWLIFVGVGLIAIFALLPLLSAQIVQLVAQIPAMVTRAQHLLSELPLLYPQLFDAAQIEEFSATLRSELVGYGQRVLVFSLDQVGSVISIFLYLFLVPLLVFFLLKDKRSLLAWCGGFLPRETELAERVWRELDRKIGSYTRGKAVEILVIWSVSWLTFRVLGLNFAMLLALATGLSVLIPYVGVAGVAIPVVLVALFQWGWSGEFAAAVGAYAVIQLLDGNLLGPLLLAGAVKIHPVAIIGAVLFFGGIWGFWGLFFAVPLATLVHAVLNVWPSRFADAPAPEEA